MSLETLAGRIFESRAGRVGYVAGLTLVLTALGFWAAVEIGLPTSTLANAALTDAPFAKNAELVDLQSQRFAQLAQDKAGSEAVRNLASQILADQNLTSGDLKQAAFRENISLPTDLDLRQQAAYDRLSALSGREFDNAYAHAIVRQLTDDVQVFRHEAASGNDDVIRRFATKTLPVLENHLTEARGVLQKVTPPAPAKKATSNRAASQSSRRTK
jgi:putative membrane protein